MRRRYSAGVVDFREKLFELARDAMRREDWLYSSACMSGADRAEAPVYACVRRFYVRVALGEDPDVVAADEDAKWRAYAVENNAEIERAPKLRYGPSAGMSATHYRYTASDLFERKLPHLRMMVRLSGGRA